MIALGSAEGGRQVVDLSNVTNIGLLFRGLIYNIGVAFGVRNISPPSELVKREGKSPVKTPIIDEIKGDGPKPREQIGQRVKDWLDTYIH